MPDVTKPRSGVHPETSSDYTLGWRKMVAFPDQMSAISFVSAAEQADRNHCDVAFSLFGE